MISNIVRFGDRAEFRADMVQGLQSAAAKLHTLLARLSTDDNTEQQSAVVDPAEVVSRVALDLSRKETPVRAILGHGGARVRIAPCDLQSALTHLITNAIEASSHGDEVMVRVQNEPRRIVIEITDKGAGMSAEFVRNSLFVPRKSTKAGGHGMGAYQARHLIRAMGGELEVTSAVGRGTVMRVFLPFDRTVSTVREALVS
jgi:signal transduction histidine kinase